MKHVELRLLTLSLLAGASAAQGLCFEPPVPFATGSDPRSVVLADVDGDGDQDAAMLCTTPAHLAVLLQDGHGVFALPLNASMPGVAELLVATDLEGDGDTDFVAEASEFYVFTNAGNGTFTSQTVSSGIGATGLACGDLDGDGDADLVTVQYLGLGVHVLTVLVQGPIGTFTPHGFASWLSGPTVLELGDIDGDADLDLFALKCDWDELTVYRNNGAGGFSVASSPPVDFFTIDLEAADFDGDGDLDLASIGGFTAPYSLRVFANIGGGSFASPVTTPLASAGQQLAAADFDGDGAVDLAVDQTVPVAGGGFSYGLAILENLGALAFGAGPQIPLSGYGFAAAKLDVDADVDLVAPVSSQGALLLIRGCSSNGITLCAGDGTAIACPCANNGAPGSGCANSLFISGAALTQSGIARVSADSAVLSAHSMTGSLAVFFQGATPIAPVVIDDGIGCVGGPILRLGNKPASSGASSFPQPGDPSISVRGAISPAGGTFYYQCYYRNVTAAFCPPATSNRTNAIAVTWSP